MPTATTYLELLTIAGGYTPERLRTQEVTRELCFSGIYAIYARLSSLPEVARKYMTCSYYATDSPGYVLLYIGRGRKTSPTRFVGVRLCKECGGNTRESQAPL